MPHDLPTGPGAGPVVRADARAARRHAASRLTADPWAGSRTFAALLAAVLFGAGAAGLRAYFAADRGLRQQDDPAAADLPPGATLPSVDDFYLRAMDLVDLAVGVCDNPDPAIRERYLQFVPEPPRVRVPDVPVEQLALLGAGPVVQPAEKILRSEQPVPPLRHTYPTKGAGCEATTRTGASSASTSLPGVTWSAVPPT